jgi:maltose alpha-D-glucosyltransferase/alpha-amylase
MRSPSGLTVRESPRAVHAQSPPLIDLSGLSDGKSLPDILHLLERRLTQLEDVVLPSYLAERRWFGRKDQALSACRVACISRLTAIDPAIALCELETMAERPAGQTAERWLLPLAVVWADDHVSPLSRELALAYVSFDRSAGLLTDAFSLPLFAHSVLEALASAERRPSSEGEVAFEGCDEAGGGRAVADDDSVTWLSAEQSNSSLIVGRSVMLKIFRRVASGPHPEAEMGRYLTEGGFGNVPRLLGEVMRIDGAGRRHSLAVVQEFVPNQGDAWSWMQQRLTERLDARARWEADGDGEQDCLRMAAAIGRRLGEMHVALARPTDNPAFSPREAMSDDAAAWVGGVEQELDRACTVLGRGAAEHADCQELLQHRTALLRALPRLAAAAPGSTVSRIHGDFHLGQVLVVDRDVYIIDFEGEPLKAADERRAKASPLNDVAGMLRSFHYATAAAATRDRTSSLTDDVSRRVLAQVLQSAETVFLEAYRQSAKVLLGLENQDLLDLFLLRKAAYEVGYEAANRPAWLSVPLKGLLDIARRVVGSPAATTP